MNAFTVFPPWKYIFFKLNASPLPDLYPMQDASKALSCSENTIKYVYAHHHQIPVQGLHLMNTMMYSTHVSVGW